jgi:phosphate transport system substrate-binding protein
VRIPPSASALFGGLALVLWMLPAQAQIGRDHINIVGSSTVYPFATVVAENFGRQFPFKSPKIEPTGSGGGLKLFCGGVGLEHPDIATTSRKIKASELALCRQNGVHDIVEIKIGYDGIVLANARSGPRLRLTSRQIFLALAARIPDPRLADPVGAASLVPNPYRSWNEIDPALPAQPIEVLGPPPTSGTRDKFAERAMSTGCDSFDWIRALRDTDPESHQEICQKFREDGRYIEAGESDVLIVRKLEQNPQAIGIFGFSFLDDNLERIQGATINGTAPTYENILEDEYALCRSLYLYVNREHVGRVPGLPEFLEAFTAAEATGPDGYLAEHGFIPLAEDERRDVEETAQSLTAVGAATSARSD